MSGKLVICNRASPGCFRCPHAKPHYRHPVYHEHCECTNWGRCGTPSLGTNKPDARVRCTSTGANEEGEE
jgi:hypothetical protein